MEKSDAESYERQLFYQELLVMCESYYYRWQSEGARLAEIYMGLGGSSSGIRDALHAWWSRTRCHELATQFYDGEKTISEVREELPTSVKGMKDFETWLSWMLETPLLKSLSTS